MVEKNRAVVGFNLVYLTQDKDMLKKGMELLFGYIKEGKLKKVPVSSFPLEKTAEAHAALESGKTTGKLVLTA